MHKKIATWRRFCEKSRTLRGCRCSNSHQFSNAGARGDVPSGMDDGDATTIDDFNRALFGGCPVGSLELAGELTERSLGYPLNVMSLLYYECGDSLTVPEADGNEGAPRS